jgi:hypothetical protein
MLCEWNGTARARIDAARRAHGTRPASRSAACMPCRIDQ